MRSSMRLYAFAFRRGSLRRLVSGCRRGVEDANNVEIIVCLFVHDDVGKKT